ncbi:MULTISPECIES: hypothetical protein [unclassified Ruegeria]|uniref:hypothetical protein n=1 Tax=unclassified Ruegeria TaxID=2625375 RepID=UPI001487705B|nr:MULTISPECIES: hypothetical protein [unclassified Ruegeria]
MRRHPVSTGSFGKATHDTRYGDPFFSTDGRMFLSMSPLGASKAKLYERLSDGTMVEYPSKEANDNLGAVIAARITDDGVMWILDLGKRSFTGWDINANKLVATYDLPADALVEHSFLQDYALDQKRRHLPEPLFHQRKIALPAAPPGPSIHACGKDTPVRHSGLATSPKKHLPKQHRHQQSPVASMPCPKPLIRPARTRTRAMELLQGQSCFGYQPTPCSETLRRYVRISYYLRGPTNPLSILLPDALRSALGKHSPAKEPHWRDQT